MATCRRQVGGSLSLLLLSETSTAITTMAGFATMWSDLNVHVLVIARKMVCSWLTDLLQLRSKPLEEVEKGLVAGPFSRDTLDASYGIGRWRAPSSASAFDRKVSSDRVTTVGAQARTMVPPH